MAAKANTGLVAEFFGESAAPGPSPAKRQKNFGKLGKMEGGRGVAENYPKLPEAIQSYLQHKLGWLKTLEKTSQNGG